MTRAAISKSYKQVLGSSVATDVMKDLQSFCFDDRTTYVVNDPYSTVFNEGKRAVFKHIQFYLNVDPSKLDGSAVGGYAESKGDK